MAACPSSTVLGTGHSSAAFASSSSQSTVSKAVLWFLAFEIAFFVRHPDAGAVGKANEGTVRHNAVLTVANRRLVL